ncbi:MAG: MOSC domain-containing protein, partial [Bacteroidota bacterium]
LVEPDGQFITQRKHPAMALIGLRWKEEEEVLQIFDQKNGKAPIDLKVNSPASTSSISVQIWDDRCEAQKVSAEYDHWFSEVLGFPCHLVYMPDTTHRPVDSNHAIPSDEVSFADGFPYLICNEASLADLNSKLDHPVTMDRFRPNLIYSGQQAWEEDDWRSFSIGIVSFRSLKPCARCTLITVDPQTSEKGIEPLRTLATFRKVNNKVLFGMNACWDYTSNEDQPMEIRVGDNITPQL